LLSSAYVRPAKPAALGDQTVKSLLKQVKKQQRKSTKSTKSTALHFVTINWKRHLRFETHDVTGHQLLQHSLKSGWLSNGTFFTGATGICLLHAQFVADKFQGCTRRVQELAVFRKISTWQSGFKM